MYNYVSASHSVGSTSLFSDTLISYSYAQKSFEVDFAREQANTYPAVRIFQASDGNLRVNIGVRWSVCDTNEPPNFVVCTRRNRAVDRSIARTGGPDGKNRRAAAFFFYFETSEEKTCREDPGR